MIKKITTITASLALAGVLGACSDNGNEAAEGTNNNNNEEVTVDEEEVNLLPNNVNAALVMTTASNSKAGNLLSMADENKALAKGDSEEDSEDNNDEESEDNDSNNNDSKDEEEIAGATQRGEETEEIGHLKDALGEDVTIHDLWEEDLFRLSDEEFVYLMTEEEAETFENGGTVHADKAGVDVFQGFGSDYVKSEEAEEAGLEEWEYDDYDPETGTYTPSDEKMEELEEEEVVEPEDMEPTPYIEELEAKYGDNVTMDELTDEERSELDMYEATYFHVLEDNQ
ncbi:MAG TPA: hypothetical protein VK108_02245 [Pseudogracilibacillus sp.]|nr:hypothetical protein [Pseudogracilibacillus sp.]